MRCRIKCNKKTALSECFNPKKDTRLAEKLDELRCPSVSWHRRNSLNALTNCDILNIRKAPTPKWMLPKRLIYLSLRGAHSVCRRGGHYFFRFFLSLSRKVSNAIIKPPEDTSRASIPKITIMIS